jgi:hypothetical protein
MVKQEKLRVDIGLFGSGDSKTLKFRVDKPAKEVLALRSKLSSAVSPTSVPRFVIDQNNIAILLTDRLSKTAELQSAIEIVLRVVATHFHHDVRTDVRVVYDELPSNLNLQRFITEQTQKEYESTPQPPSKDGRHLRALN